MFNRLIVLVALLLSLLQAGPAAAASMQIASEHASNALTEETAHAAGGDACDGECDEDCDADDSQELPDDDVHVTCVSRADLACCVELTLETTTSPALMSLRPLFMPPRG